MEFRQTKLATSYPIQESMRLSRKISMNDVMETLYSRLRKRQKNNRAIIHLHEELLINYFQNLHSSCKNSSTIKRGNLSSSVTGAVLDQHRPFFNHHQGPSIYDVRKILGFFDPPSPLHPHFTQPISTVRPQNWAIPQPPPPSVLTS